MKIKLEFKPQDLWIGVFWKKTPKGTLDAVFCPVKHDSLAPGACCPVTTVSVRDVLDVWLTLVPCFPLHFIFEGPEAGINHEGL